MLLESSRELIVLPSLEATFNVANQFFSRPSITKLSHEMRKEIVR